MPLNETAIRHAAQRKAREAQALRANLARRKAAKRQQDLNNRPEIGTGLAHAAPADAVPAGSGDSGRDAKD